MYTQIADQAGNAIGPGTTLIFDLELVKVFDGEARSYPGSLLLENVVLGPIPSMGYFCLRTWMVLVGVILWGVWDIRKKAENQVGRFRKRR